MRSAHGAIKFDELYKRLNAKQKQAVDAIEGPVMVIAGPGTGKTSILTLRIANILQQTDTEPENILALTFTESGVQSMREKLIEIIGPMAYRINIFTFHSFANYIIKKYPDEFPRIVGAENASEVQKILIVEKIIDQNKFEYIKPYGDTHYYVPSIISSIKHLKRENISSEELKEIIKKERKNYDSITDLIYEEGAHEGKIKGRYKDLEKNINKKEELLKVYEKYEEELQRQRLYDFEDMLLELIKVMTLNEDFLLSLQEQYQYILADEHQDANNAQNAILELLSSFHENPNLFIVGDEKQAIFRFQGASLANFLYFKNKYKDVLLISLENNYRSTQSILDASHELIGFNQTNEELRIQLLSQKIREEHPISLAEFNTEEEERSFVIDEVKKIIALGIPHEEIAVLYRKNKEADAYVTEFSRAGIPFSLYSDKDMLDDPDIRKLILVLSAINDPSNDELIGQISFFDIFDLQISSVYEAFKKSRKNRLSVLAAFKEDEKLSVFVEEIFKLSLAAKNQDLISFFEVFLSEIEWGIRLLKTRHPLSRLSSFDAFIEEIKKYAELDRTKKLTDFLDYLKTVENYKIRISTTNRHRNSGTVALMTAHKSKGLEFTYVFIVGANDKTWGKTRDIKKFDLPLVSPSEVEDSRRLFYVAITRAKQKVFITYSLIGKDGKEALPSQFIFELKESLVDKVQAPKTGNKANFAFASSSEKLLDKEYLRSLFLNESFSVTAFNNFLECPWKYFFNNLIRLPRLQTKHQLYGIAVHATLNYLFSRLSEKKEVSKEEMLNVFKIKLEEQPLSLNDFEDSLIKGQKALSGYFDTYQSSWKTNVLGEYNISGIALEVPGIEKSVQIRGVIDKIELSKENPADAQKVHVVDYKTRKPLSRNEIEGKTKNSNGNYKRQLLFYKFLLSNQIIEGSDTLTQKRGRTPQIYEMETGEIDFIEPDDNIKGLNKNLGKYKKEIFDIKDEEVNEMLLQLKKTLKDIYSFDFFDKGCGEDDCDECKLAKLIL
jgi:DNA helicase II / ATP-dependent DNA helicase PcrA